MSCDPPLARAAHTGRAGDLVAISLSSLCLVHCLALPLVAGLLPLAGAWAEAPWVHWTFAAFAAPVSAWTLSRPHPRRPAWGAIGLATLGLCLLVAGAAEFPSHALETPITVSGGLLLATAHGLNWRRRPRHHHPD
ncbi:hypothetical protein KOAAANKH_00753 [Brevundimonas sp. NIBR10]|uniref:MerC domain-containing protein n=1 Tax=Brevundimonas sp. NIBR10 TaxID=3015997 RepID=UPI0022F17825|nr:MerC domain-containing protein [Brevundimonas sp. NIBR10]WGM45888.1 hypothetical protein KOAAANKH_00753 [Brevundimonas sp. NIBR10]